MYTPHDPEDHTMALSVKMLYNTERDQLLKEVYPEAIINDLTATTKDVREILRQFTLENCKLVLISNDIFDSNKI